MPTPHEQAEAHRASRARLIDSTTARALRTWRMADVDALDASWDVLAPVLVDSVSEAQIVAASAATAYTAAAVPTRAAPAVTPEAFAGVTLDGREIGPAMFGAVTTTKSFIGRGASAARAFEAGAAFLATIVKSSVADAGRQADRVQATAHTVTRYVRVIRPGACSRCAILAGTGSYSTAFQRHPNCRCTAYPLADPAAGVPDGFYSSPSDYFESLPKGEQDRIFTEAGAQAIRDGADFSQVVNARRGLVAPPKRGLTAPLGYDRDGTPIKVLTTSEGTTIRGAFGRAEYRRQAELKKGAGDRYRRTTNQRLMPETVYAIARGDTAKAKELLEFYGYLS